MFHHRCFEIYYNVTDLLLRHACAISPSPLAALIIPVALSSDTFTLPSAQSQNNKTLPLINVQRRTALNIYTVSCNYVGQTSAEVM